MNGIFPTIEAHVWLAWAVLAVAFAVLAKCADAFVDSAVALAKRFRIPRLIVGIVLVSLATTAPELSVSLMSALQGFPEMALGNAIGSVICNTGLALGLAGVFSVVAIPVLPLVLKTSGLFLLLLGALAFGFVVIDDTLSRWEGGVLVALFAGYLAFLFVQHRRGALSDEAEFDDDDASVVHPPLVKLIAVFALSLGGIILSSKFIVVGATMIARSFGIPEAVIALTLVALGTSIPEVATCVSAAVKREGAIAVGNIIGANIMNVCWVAGASALAHNLAVEKRATLFMFPCMFILVAGALMLMKSGYTLNRKKGFVLLGLYVLYIASFFVLYAPAARR